MIKLRSLTLKSRVIQSPMAGCTDLAFRLVARRHGMEFAFLEMVSAESLIRNASKTERLLKSVAEDRPLGAQLVGCNPQTMGEAAAMIEAMGFDLLDLNLGCPVPKIVSPGAGSALLLKPESTKEIFKHVVKKVKRIAVTVKMRKGYQNESGEEAVRIAQIAEDCGVSAITVHGRTRVQGYAGTADWKAIGKVKRAVRIPVFGNGDVATGIDAKRLVETSGCDGVMIGRGGLGNPWIYKQIDAVLNDQELPPEPTLDDRRQAALEHLKLELETEGEKIGTLKSRKIISWYFKNCPGANEFRYHINRAQSPEEMRQIIDQFYPDGEAPAARA